MLGAALIVLVAVAPTALPTQDRKAARNYHDKQNNDDHESSNHEDRTYRMYAKQDHRRYRDFSSLNQDDQQAYWGWRHDHSDAPLKIDIR